MSFLEQQPKGLARLFVDAGLPDGRLRMHISELAPGSRPHPPHQHEGVEAFYMLEGEGTLEIAEERQLIRANEGVVFDATRLHGLLNTGEAPMRYIVIIAREP
jgi:mannose-6-phosphate isomerase-like protein (cupin superfamily)